MNKTIDICNLKLVFFVPVVGLSIVGLANSPLVQSVATSATESVNNATEAVSETVSNTVDDIEAWFTGGSNSKVAIAVGNAEGTRTDDGGFTDAFQGHIDPGNGAANQGTFSYQHEAASPEEADAKQLERLKGQTQEIIAQAQSAGVELSKEALINGIDLANQAPLAALDGYVGALKDCNGDVLCARTQSYINPATGQLDAPGLGNNIHQVEADQQRRMDEIKGVIENGN